MRHHSAGPLLLLGLALILTMGCRSTRYDIGKFFSPDWMRSSDSKEKYTLYTNSAQNYIDLGSTALDKNDPSKARRHFRQAEVQFKKAIESDGYSFKAHLGTGFALLKQNTREKVLEGIDYLQIANDLRPGEWRVHYGLASAHQTLARLDGAVLDGLLVRLKAARIESDKLLLEGNIHEVQSRRNAELESALLEAREIQKHAPDQHQAFFIIGTTCADLGRFNEATENLNRFVQLAKQTRDVYECWKKAGALPRGWTGKKSELDRKIHKNLVLDAEAKDLLAALYRDQGDYLKALDFLNAIYETNPHALPRFLPARAQVKAKLGDYAGAVSDLDRYLRALGKADQEYDATARRATLLREEYMARLRRGPGKVKTASSP